MTAAAFFDVDGTLTKTTVVEPLIWYQRTRLPGWRFALWAAGLLLQAPYYLWLDRRSRSQFNVSFFRRYRGLNTAHLRDWHQQTFTQNLQLRVFPEARVCVQEARTQGKPIVLVTGGLEWVMQPLAAFFEADHLFALRMQEQNGICTGDLAVPPIADEQKAVLIKQYAAQNGIDLSRSDAYGNSFGDVPMLECVGHPVAVNPDGRLRALAQSRSWRIVDWRLL
jgi:alcohol-forming fatty acyl-CoA reductase